ncbi:hypothetical protein Tco_1530722, partial [Tanacetum coccineum]
KLTRKGKIVTCSLCKATWHNKRVCKANVSSDGGQRATTVPKKTVGRKRSISQPRNEAATQGSQASAGSTLKAATQGSQASAGSTFKRTKMTASRLTPDKIKEMKLKVFHLRSNILSRDPLPDAKGAYVLIYNEESHRAVVAGSGTGPFQRA